MVRRIVPPPAPPDSPDEIEAMFYQAMQQGDIEQLMALWAEEEEVSCVHPGGGRVLGTTAIRASFEAIFAHGHVDVQPEVVRRTGGQSWSVHHVLERVRGVTPDGPQEVYVIATNVYVRTVAGWRLLVHHTSPGGAPELEGITEPATLLH